MAAKATPASAYFSARDFSRIAYWAAIGHSTPRKAMTVAFLPCSSSSDQLLPRKSWRVNGWIVRPTAFGPAAGSAAFTDEPAKISTISVRTTGWNLEGMDGFRGLGTGAILASAAESRNWIF